MDIYANKDLQTSLITFPNRIMEQYISFEWPLDNGDEKREIYKRDETIILDYPDGNSETYYFINEDVDFPIEKAEQNKLKIEDANISISRWIGDYINSNGSVIQIEYVENGHICGYYDESAYANTLFSYEGVEYYVCDFDLELSADGNTAEGHIRFYDPNNRSYFMREGISVKLTLLDDEIHMESEEAELAFDTIYTRSN